jgi:hypothetical protein
VYRHVILFRWRPGTTQAQVAAAHDELATLPLRLPQIRGWSAGPDEGGLDHNADYVIVADFADRAGYLAYRDDPYHLAVIDRVMAPIIADYVRLQYTVGRPVSGD